MDRSQFNSKIKVFGVGGAGINMLNYFVEKSMTGVYYACFDTSTESLEQYKGEKKLFIPLKFKFVLDERTNPSEICDSISGHTIAILNELITSDTKIVFIAAGMGGITGTGMAPVIARLCRDKGILVVGVVTLPFSFEEYGRQKTAELGINELQNNIDKLFAISNDKIQELYGDIGLQTAFKKGDEILYHCVLYTQHLLNKPVPFKDIRHFFRNGSVARDEDRAISIGYKIAMGREGEGLLQKMD